MGVLLGLAGRPTLFPDRFQLGGPTNIRMFRQNSMGPRDGRASLSHSPVICCTHLVVVDSVGGDLYWAAGISAISALPRKPHWPLKAHFFLNAGRLDALDSRTSFPPFSLIRAIHPSTPSFPLLSSLSFSLA